MYYWRQAMLRMYYVLLAIGDVKNVLWYYWR
jgi:hypothetical protein